MAPTTPWRRAAEAMYKDLIAYTDVVREQYLAYLERMRGEVEEAAPLSFAYDRRSAGRLADWIAEQHAAGLSFCLIRLGDGEGACLMDEADSAALPELHAAVATRTLGLHFGRADYGRADWDFWYRSIADAAKSADLIACPTREVCNAAIDAAAADIRGTVGTLSAWRHVERARDGIDAKLFATWHAHVALLPHYPRLLAGKRVTLVTCYTDDFGERFAKSFGCEKVSVIGIPGQSVNERGRIFEPLYPNRYDATLEAVGADVGKGDFCVVAAGLAGKALCARAAANGAVALDVGSIMDVWYGRGVRPYQGEDFVTRNALPDLE